MVVRIADQAGFCFGVKRALELINGLRREGQEIQILGELIHNKSALKDLEKKGVHCISDWNDLNPGKTLVIRTHGIPADQEECLRARGMRLMDATCPLVKKTHRIIRDFEKRRIPVVIVGDRNHPEIIAASSYATNPTIVNSLEEARAVPHMKRMGVVAQTTLDLAFFREIEKILAERADEPEVFNTVCEATRVRQEAVRRLAPEVDCVVVVGGRNSSNTKKLVQIARRHNPRTFHIESSGDLEDPELIRRIGTCRTVGITAGASTPPQDVEQVRHFFEELTAIKDCFEIDKRRMNDGQTQGN